MIIGDVTGVAVASASHYKLEGRKLLLVQPVRPDGEPSGAPLIAVDGRGIGAGEGDRVVLVLEGRSASLVSGRDESPIDAAIVAVVDHVNLA